MSMPVLEPPPSAYRIRLETQADGIRMILLGRTFRSLLPEYILFVLLLVPATGWAVVIAPSLIAEASPGDRFAVGAALLPTGLFLFCGFLVWTHIHIKSSDGLVVPAGGRLLIHEPGLFHTRRRAWPRERLRAVAAWKGLRVATTAGKTDTLFSDHSLASLAWVAQVVRQVLQVPEDLPARPGDLSVTYTGTFWDEPVAGMLNIKLGVMTLRHSFARKPHLNLRTGSVYLNTMHDAVTVTESDVSCRIDADGGACLRIAPDGVKCTIRSDRKPHLDVNLLGPFWRVTIVMDAAIGKRKLAAADKDFTLTIWCEDGQALQIALGRFWGEQDR